VRQLKLLHVENTQNDNITMNNPSICVVMRETLPHE